MKQTLTEKFLWMIYNLSEFTGNILEQTQRPALDIRAHGSWDYYSIFRAWAKEKRRKNFAKFITHLKERGYLRVKIEKNKKAILLTKKGLEKIFQISIKKTNLQERPDKKWQMVIFDIPEKSRGARDHFREGLKNLGYQQLQKSIWVSPYDVLKETEELIKFYRTEHWIKHFLIEKVEIKK